MLTPVLRPDFLLSDDLFPTLPTTARAINVKTVSDRWLTYLRSIGDPFSGRLLLVNSRSNHTWPFCVWGLVKSIHKHCVRPFIPVLLIEYSRYWEKIREVSLGPCADGQAKSVSEMHALVRATTSGLVNSQRRGSCFSKACLKSSRSLSLISETAQ